MQTCPTEAVIRVVSKIMDYLESIWLLISRGAEVLNNIPNGDLFSYSRIISCALKKVVENIQLLPEYPPPNFLVV